MDFYCHANTDVNLTRMNKIEAKYKMPQINITVQREFQLFCFTCDLPYTSSRAYPRTKYATVEIRPEHEVFSTHIP